MLARLTMLSALMVGATTASLHAQTTLPTTGQAAARGAARGAARPPAPPATEPSMTQGPYTLGPDSKVQPGVPQGKWEKYMWDKSEIFPKTTREVWVYIPAQYDEKVPAALMVFQDGPRQYALRQEDPAEMRRGRHTVEYCVPTVMDNLIAKKELPVMIAVFINPGSFAIAENGTPDFQNRSVEYDSVADDYSQFLMKEILPPIEKKYNIRKDAAGRAIGGLSSGAICAFTVAFNHPDQFGKVLSDIGSFTNIKGGHVYPKLIAEAPKKPIRVHLQDGTNDNRRPDAPEKDWFLQNRLMHEALLAKGYDVKYVLGNGAHDSRHGGAILPDSLRWLWRDDPSIAKTATMP